MDLNYNTINLFPSIIHQFDVNGFDEIQNQLIDYAYQFKIKDPAGVIYSNHGGWQSTDFSINNEDDVLRKEKDILYYNLNPLKVSFFTSCLIPPTM